MVFEFTTNFVRELICAVGEDPKRDGLRDTPDRVARTFTELLSGYWEDPLEVCRTFEQGEIGGDPLVLVRGIEFTSICEHHLLPFMGEAHVAYIPRDRVLGLSKIVRIVSILSRRLQTQERLTVQIADTLVQGVSPLGVMVVIDAEHLCMRIRGVRSPRAYTTTSAVRGVFTDDPQARAEALALLGRREVR